MSAKKPSYLVRSDGEPLMGKLTPMGYHEDSARDARARIVAFFGAHLKH